MKLTEDLANKPKPKFMSLMCRLNVARQKEEQKRRSREETRMLRYFHEERMGIR